jgi:hypothetical protein
VIIRETKIVHKNFPRDAAGTISLESTAMLWLIAKYFQPIHVFEVGTFIGRSSMALISGAEDSVRRLDTCDYTFDNFFVTDCLKQHIPGHKVLNYWPKTASANALHAIMSNGMRPDLFFIDGRIGADDLKYISALDRAQTVFVLDDFEGTEKGVENCLALRAAFPELMLIRPYIGPSGRPMNTAILVPPGIITLTRQQETPIAMQ